MRDTIQFLRGTSEKIELNKSEQLAPGQPLYNYDKNYLTVGDSSDNANNLDKSPITVREVVGYAEDYNGITPLTTTKYSMTYRPEIGILFENNIKGNGKLVKSAEVAGPQSFAWGGNDPSILNSPTTTVSGTQSAGFGQSVDVKGSYAFGAGKGSTVKGEGSSSFGVTNWCSGDNTHTIGSHLSTIGTDQIVLGKYNQMNSDDAFQIGYGTDDMNQLNIFSVSKDGGVRSSRPALTSDELMNLGQLTSQSHTFTASQNFKSGIQFLPDDYGSTGAIYIWDENPEASTHGPFIYGAGYIRDARNGNWYINFPSDEPGGTFATREWILGQTSGTSQTPPNFLKKDGDSEFITGSVYVQNSTGLAVQQPSATGVPTFYQMDGIQLSGEPYYGENGYVFPKLNFPQLTDSSKFNQTIATQEWVSENVGTMGGGSANLETGTGEGSVDQVSATYTGESFLFVDGYKGTQNNDVVPGAEASGFQSAAFGGLKYDYYTSPETHSYNLSIDPEILEHIGRTPTSAEGNQSFAAGGSAHAHGDWSVALNKDTDAYQKGSFACGGGTLSGLTEEQFNEIYTTQINGKRYPSYLSDYSNSEGYGFGKNIACPIDVNLSTSSSIHYRHPVTNSDITISSVEAEKFNVVEGRQGLPYKESWGFGFASGEVTQALGRSSFAANYANKATGIFSAAFNENNQAIGENSFIVGKNGIAQGSASFVTGEGGQTKSPRSAVFGLNCVADEGSNNSIAGGQECVVQNQRAIAFGIKSIAGGTDSVAIGEVAKTNAGKSLALGKNVTANGSTSIAMGDGSTANKYLSIALGYTTTSSGTASFSGGTSTQATGEYAFAYGTSTKATNLNTVAFGNSTQASGNNSTAFGVGGVASGTSSFKLGEGSRAEAYISLAMGYNSKAQATGSIAGGVGSVSESTSAYSISFGEGIITKNKLKAAFGTYNNPDVSNALFTLGNGTSGGRSNAMTVLTTGQVLAGKSTTSTDSNLCLVTKDYVDSLVSRISALETALENIASASDIDTIFNNN